MLLKINKIGVAIIPFKWYIRACPSPCFALIVGLHFFPLGKIFNRSFDYYMGAWTSLVAIAGIVLMHQKTWPVYLITTMVCCGCALATSVYGVMMVLRGHKIVYDTSISIH